MWVDGYKITFAANRKVSGGGSGFPLSLSELSFTLCLMPYYKKRRSNYYDIYIYFFLNDYYLDIFNLRTFSITMAAQLN